MKSIWDTIKAHPYLFGGAVGLVVLYIYLRSGSSKTTSQSQYPYDVYQDPNVINAEANLAAQQQQDNVAQSLGTAEIGAQTTAAQLQAGTIGQWITANQTAIADQSNALLGIAQSQYGAQTQIAQIQASAQEQLAQTAGQNALALQQNQNASQLAFAEAVMPTTVLQDELAALTTITGQQQDTLKSVGTQGAWSGVGLAALTGQQYNNVIFGGGTYGVFGAGAPGGPPNVSGRQVTALFNNIMAQFQGRPITPVAISPA